MTVTLINGSASDLSMIEAGSVQTCVTSPPYWGLRQYAGEQRIAWSDGTEHALGLEPTPELYVAHMVEVFREVRRVLRKDGTLWLNLGDSYAGGRSGPNGVNGEMANREVAKHRGFVGVTKQVAGIKDKDLVGIPWMVAFALRADGWYLRSDIIWAKPNPMPESVTDRPTKAHEYLFLLSKSERYYYDAEAIKEAAAWERWGDQTVVKEQQGTAGWISDKPKDELQERTTRNKRTVWNIATRPYPGAHFATYPEQLVEPCILAGSRAGDTVLDPFNGSGTTGRVAVRHNRSYIGVDISKEYLDEQAMKRINNVQQVMGL